MGRLVGRGALRRLVREERPDLIAAHTHHGLAMAAGLGVPLVVHRRLDFAPSRGAVARYGTVAHTIAVSEAVARVLRASGVSTPLTVVRDAVSPLGVGPWPPEDPFHVVALGALVAHKGHADLLHAMREVPGRLTIAGRGPLRRRLEQQARRVGIAERVTFAGHVPDVERLLHTAHVLAHPSREEGLGQAVLEAMTAGRPVVATRAGGLTEIVAGRGGLVPVGDPSALAAALRAVEQRPDAARDRALAVRDEVVAAHDPASLVLRTEAIYQRVTG